MAGCSDLQADLEAAKEARRAAMSAQSYSLDTGQGKQQVTRATLSELNKTIRDLQASIEQCNAEDSGSGTVTAGQFNRY